MENLLKESGKLLNNLLPQEVGEPVPEALG
jgi:hypothetical protein